ncbi:MAG: hypothetical protein PHF00_02930, partial [Elusimicrobia bacterium]|nr:hypothetical protein [Elusimicrobiota bacterium]
ASKATDKKISLVIPQNNALQIGTPIPNGDYTGGTGGFISSGGDYLRMSNRAWHDGNAWRNDTGNVSIVELGEEIANGVPYYISFKKHTGGASTTMARLTASNGGGYIYLNDLPACQLLMGSDATAINCDGSKCTPCPTGTYATFIPGVYSEGESYYNRASSVDAVIPGTTPPKATRSVVMVDPAGNQVIGELRMKDEPTRFYCCSR